MLAWIINGGSRHNETLCNLTVLVRRLSRRAQRGIKGRFGSWIRHAVYPRG